MTPRESDKLVPPAGNCWVNTPLIAGTSRKTLGTIPFRKEAMDSRACKNPKDRDNHAAKSLSLLNE